MRCIPLHSASNASISGGLRPEYGHPAPFLPSARAVKPPFVFLLATFVVSWTLWFAAAAVPPQAAFRPALFSVGAIAPGLVALGLAMLPDERPDMETLLRRVAAWRVAPQWYVFAIAYMGAIKLTAALIQRIVTGAWPSFGYVPWYFIVAAVTVSTLVQAGEEIGWRGYALPNLSGRIGLARASILLGIVWAVWHLPLFFIPGTDVAGQPFPVFALSVTALSVAMAWLYARANQSLLLVMLMHAAVNNTTGVVPGDVAAAPNPLTLTGSFIGWTTCALLWACAAFFLMRMPAGLPPANSLERL